jgi:hypothetical protein
MDRDSIFLYFNYLGSWQMKLLQGDEDLRGI